MEEHKGPPISYNSLSSGGTGTGPSNNNNDQSSADHWGASGEVTRHEAASCSSLDYPRDRQLRDDTCSRARSCTIELPGVSY
jgi:hypothetical protein